ncbi:hypothetical protein OZD61_04690, partial [Wolbachia endosymbiont of Drosophila bocki]|nr:hypothetical protein [Wolbachia endosymbiont of Drosophila bocki]
ADWLTKRDIIRTLVKRIEINFEDANIVFRVKELPDSFHMEKNQCSQCCCRGRETFLGLAIKLCKSNKFLYLRPKFCYSQVLII